MNGNFRNPKFVKRYKYNYYDLETPFNAVVANNARQTKDNYRFTVGIMHILKLTFNLLLLLMELE